MTCVPESSAGSQGASESTPRVDVMRGALCEGQHVAHTQHTHICTCARSLPEHIASTRPPHLCARPQEPHLTFITISKVKTPVKM